MKTTMLAVRLYEEDLVKLDAIAKRTHRDRSKVVRVLLDLAEPSGLADVALRAPGAETLAKERKT